MPAPSKTFAKPQMTGAQAMVQLRQLLASATDEKLAAMTVDLIVRTHKIARREAEVVLLACQESRRREIAARDTITATDAAA
jgi:hypothetical protein